MSKKPNISAQSKSAKTMPEQAAGSEENKMPEHPINENYIFIALAILFAICAIYAIADILISK